MTSTTEKKTQAAPKLPARTIISTRAKHNNARIESLLNAVTLDIHNGFQPDADQMAEIISVSKITLKK